MSVIKATDLTKTFDGVPVLNGITLSVEKGEIFGFLGPNGAGKTTAMRTMLGLLRPDRGEGLVLDSSLADCDELRSRVGVLFDNNGLFDNLSAYNNLKYYAGLYRVPDEEARIAELLEFAGLEGKKDEPVGNFSTGMKRKLGLARAILHKPEILFLDEPSSGLDPEAQRMVRELIVHLSADDSMTIFLNSHNLDEVQRVCSRVAILHHGRIQALGSVDELQDGGGGRKVEITLADPAQLHTACTCLASMTEVSAYEHSNGRIAVTLKGHSAAPVLTELIRSGCYVEEAVRVSRSLEDIYIDVMRSGEVSQ